MRSTSLTLTVLSFDELVREFLKYLSQIREYCEKLSAKPTEIRIVIEGSARWAQLRTGPWTSPFDKLNNETCPEFLKLILNTAQGSIFEQLTRIELGVVLQVDNAKASELRSRFEQYGIENFGGVTMCLRHGREIIAVKALREKSFTELGKAILACAEAIAHLLEVLAKAE